MTDTTTTSHTSTTSTRAIPTGRSILAGESVVGAGATVHGVDPATGEILEPGYALIDEDQLRTATAAAEAAFASFRGLAPEDRAAFLERIADNLDAVGEELVDRAMAETGLTRARLTGERGRTTGQLRLFAGVVRQGDHHGARIDPARPERTPSPRADIRQRTVPLGPVAVFGASNFPLAFSTAGGDTASALAAGCPVVVKAHNAHPGTAEIVGRAVTDAVAETGLHPGVFSLVYGQGSLIGQALVADPAIQAVGFTGSRGAGLSLVATAAARPVPIPVYAEMSSINPVFLFDGALRGDVEALATAFVGSVTGSSGQLCTAPGLVFVPSGPAGDAFASAVRTALGTTSGQTMLTAAIADSWTAGVEELGGRAGVELLARGIAGESENAPAPAVFATDVATFLSDDVLQQEVFGAASLLIRYSSADELLDAAEHLEGQLTATLHLTEADHPAAAPLLPVLEHRAGRILAGGWPTGVEVGHAMVHGGPFPATSNSRTTSVGTLAIDRFLRPVAYQDIPDELLPAPLREDNPWHLTRRRDGLLESAGEEA
ncbi:2,5-dioxovalerate dehydrogenase [Brachybacterium sp. P6-10-X1]|uniref:aldehyde dehydrogenase (NADP(+)) n=1 Tax=Brachybacterium sp. P6-10-X1 TaxID=1903186 RepID=UPI000971A3A7|nr:aldehyde dehydrogenase (NADP(+)) [Brachybacterium sp. P6-10-X1]APX32072.1 2,5-dioxovalerate dehydrogenase [Brachybacterium sp. P6-10-X1]